METDSEKALRILSRAESLEAKTKALNEDTQKRIDEHKKLREEWDRLQGMAPTGCKCPKCGIIH